MVFPFCFTRETVKTVSEKCQCLSTGLKPGVNEKDFDAKLLGYSLLKSVDEMTRFQNSKCE